MAYSGADELDATPLRLPQSDAPNLSMEIDQKDLMVNYISPSDDYLEIPLRMDPGAKGNYTMDFSGFNKFREYQCINLIDNETGEQIPLSSASTYALNAESADEPIYMTLILSQKDYENCIASEDYSSDPVRISSYEKNIFMDFNLDQRAQADVVIYNALGDRIHSQSFVAGYARQTINLGFVNAGVYFVNIHINGSTFSEKVVLK